MTAPSAYPTSDMDGSDLEPPELDPPDEEEDLMLDATEADEQITPEDIMDDGESEDGADGMEEDGVEEEVDLDEPGPDNSVAYMDAHTDSLFAVAAHPLDSTLVATGSGDDTACVFSIAGVIAGSEDAGSGRTERKRLEPLARLHGHTDSVAALAFSLPRGEVLFTGGLDGQVRAYDTQRQYALLGHVQEVEEVCWLLPCPHPSYPNVFALGAVDGSVWVYECVVEEGGEEPLRILQTYHQHKASSTAGAWSPSGQLLASVSEDSSLYVYDPFGEAAAAGVAPSAVGQAVVGLTAEDQRFAVDGGLYSVAIAPSGSFLAAGGEKGIIRIVGLPIIGGAGAEATSASATKSQKGAGSKSKVGGSKQNPSRSSGAGQAGQILASLQAQTDSVETLSFSSAPHTLLAAGSVDASIALYDYAHNFAIRRLIKEAHEDQAVVQLSFWRPSSSPRITSSGPWLLTSCGMDGAIRRWDTRGGTTESEDSMGLLREWRGHGQRPLGVGEEQRLGVMAFVECGAGGGGVVVTAGDDGLALVFDLA